MEEDFTLYGEEISLNGGKFYLPDPSFIWCMPRCNLEYDLLVPLELKRFKECSEKNDKEEYLSMMQDTIDYIQQHIGILVVSSIAQKNSGYDDELEKRTASELGKTTEFLESIIDKLSEEK
jgi:hypothetical protein